MEHADARLPRLLQLSAVPEVHQRLLVPVNEHGSFRSLLSLLHRLQSLYLSPLHRSIRHPLSSSQVQHYSSEIFPRLHHHPDLVPLHCSGRLQDHPFTVHLPGTHQPCRRLRHLHCPSPDHHHLPWNEDLHSKTVRVPKDGSEEDGTPRRRYHPPLLRV